MGEAHGEAAADVDDQGMYTCRVNEWITGMDACNPSRISGTLDKKKVVHRDIKSLNVVLDRDFHAKWCDFGLATLKLHTTTTSKNPVESMVGTLYWMAPELFSRKTATPSTASDIWALGMVYFELASRQIPFAMAMDKDQVKDWIKEGDGEEVPAECHTASPALASIMQRCWAGRTERPSAAEIAGELGTSNRGGTAHASASDKKSAASTESNYMPYSRG